MEWFSEAGMQTLPSHEAPLLLRLTNAVAMAFEAAQKHDPNFEVFSRLGGDKVVESVECLVREYMVDVHKAPAKTSSS